MKRFTAMLLCLCCLAGCAAAPADKQATGYSFTDDLGRTVTVDAPQRVATLLGSFAQIWMLSGGQVCAAPDDAWEDLALDMPQDATDLGKANAMNLELLLAARPDFVLATTGILQDLQWQETLESMGIPVAYFQIDDFEDYLRLLDICTHITGRRDLFETHGTQVQAQIERVLENRFSEGPKVLCMVASASVLRAKRSQGNVLGAMLKNLGCQNIADSNDLILEDLSIEHILKEDPEHIFIVQRGDDEAGMRAYVAQYMAEHPAWGELTAVKEGRVHFMDKNLFNLKPNHRWGEAYAILEEILLP